MPHSRLRRLRAVLVVLQVVQTNVAVYEGWVWKRLGGATGKSQKISRQGAASCSVTNRRSRLGCSRLEECADAARRVAALLGKQRKHLLHAARQPARINLLWREPRQLCAARDRIARRTARGAALLRLAPAARPAAAPAGSRAANGDDAQPQLGPVVGDVQRGSPSWLGQRSPPPPPPPRQQTAVARPRTYGA